MYPNLIKCQSPDPKFIYDEACLDFHNNFKDEVQIYGQNVECHKCDYQFLFKLPAQNNASLLVNTKYNMRMQYIHNGSTLCEMTHEFLEHYRYMWNISDKCTPLTIVKDADSAYIPILSAFIILFCFGTFWYMIKCIYKCTRDNVFWRRIMMNSTEMENDLGSTTDTVLVIERPPHIKKQSQRMKSIDVFRGICIIIMIFCNYGGGQYWFFKHSIWNGLTIADLVFPWFVWLMGLSMEFSMNKKLRRAVPRRQIAMHCVKRSLILIAIGIILSTNKDPHLETFRFLGILQRLGLSYMIVGLIETCFSKRSPSNYRQCRFVPEVLTAIPQWMIMISLVVIHTCITFLMTFPGCAAGYLGPGGLDDGGKYENCTGGAAGFIDRTILRKHVFNSSQNLDIYDYPIFKMDPEGVLGTLTAAFMAFLGVHAGRIFKSESSIQTKVTKLMVYGIVFAIVGGALCGFSKEGGPIPINKKLWSLSMVFALSGAAYVIIAILHVLVDVTRKWGGRPIFYPGMNPLVLYILHYLFKDTLPFGWKIRDSQTHSAYLSMNLWGTALWVCFSVYLYKKNIIISL
ncbi:PREDICTED: heparan-alpha-glucosaminide N-acetyltransferase-like [Nicrophorus vespilloides]|uniref:Heparan-alpha-glucosaminide N-acetyltransferase-like n=1 Tax=Nicrophorus vespilloides TaxID=110193 RepID=A0ABM1N9R3_NICVS|nr:PREDICTED: heparan-alpha-glucosaminide N-acetyltransferase-like [Nicrophorus vespilloides]